MADVGCVARCDLVEQRSIAVCSDGQNDVVCRIEDVEPAVRGQTGAGLIKRIKRSLTTAFGRDGLEGLADFGCAVVVRAARNPTQGASEGAVRLMDLVWASEQN